MGAMTTHWPAISAHRGGAEDAPFATWEAYLACVDTSADYVELDIRRTADHELVAYHDPDVSSAAGRPLVRDLTYRQLCEVAGYQVPRVPELLEQIASHARGHLDLKEVGYERRLLHLASDLLGADNFLVSTLEEESVRAIKDEFPAVPVALSLGRDLSEMPRWRRAPVRFRELFPLRRIRRSGADWVSMHYRFAGAGVLRACAAEGLRAMVWTVNDDALIDRYLTDDRVAVLITDRPRYAAERRSSLLGAVRRATPDTG